MINCLVLMILIFLFGECYSSDFYKHWGDGQAEISSYDVKVLRYNQMRSGRAVLIFVTEDINTETLIKVESPTPKNERMYVMKLNHIIRFNTGIYDYSVMSSVFSQVVGIDWPFALRKVTMSAQDWCGHIFDEVKVDANRVEGRINSYFERDGLSSYTIPISLGFVSGDGILVRMRELGGEWLEPGEQIPISLFPSLWGIRLRGLQRKIIEATLSKGMAKDLELSFQVIPAHKWQLDFGNTWEKYWVEKAYPHRILAWEFSDGGRGELRETVRLSYWLLNNNNNAEYRRLLDIDPEKSGY